MSETETADQTNTELSSDQSFTSQLDFELKSVLSAREINFKHLSKCMAESDSLVTTEKSNITRGLAVRASSLKTSMQAKFIKIKNLDEKIMDLCTDQASKNKVLESLLNLEDEYIYVNTKLDDFLNSVSLEQDSSSSVSSKSQNNVKLPKLSLSKFDGDIVNWRGFWDQFKTAIHENESLSDTEKFTYLKSLLTRSAFTAIEGLTLSSVNYTEALEILSKRYGNEQVLISAFMSRMVQLLKIKADNNILGLRSMYDQVEFSV